MSEPHKWRHTACDACWETLGGGKEAVKLVERWRVVEDCCFCGRPHRSGIYVRWNPAGLRCQPVVLTGDWCWTCDWCKHSFTLTEAARQDILKTAVDDTFWCTKCNVQMTKEKIDGADHRAGK